MFIPVWVFHLIVTGIVGVICFSIMNRQRGTTDFFPYIQIPCILLLYAIYWIIILLTRGGF